MQDDLAGRVRGKDAFGPIRIDRSVVCEHIAVRAGLQDHRMPWVLEDVVVDVVLPRGEIGEHAVALSPTAVCVGMVQVAAAHLVIGAREKFHVREVASVAFHTLHPAMGGAFEMDVRPFIRRGRIRTDDPQAFDACMAHRCELPEVRCGMERIVRAQRRGDLHTVRIHRYHTRQLPSGSQRPRRHHQRGVIAVEADLVIHIDAYGRRQRQVHIPPRTVLA